MTVPSTGASAHPSRTHADQYDTDVIVLTTGTVTGRVPVGASA